MESFFTAFFAALLWALAVMLPVGGFSLLLHFLLSLPMQRRDRARFFLDLLETALERGQPVEQAILSAAESRDRVMGVRFYMLAAHIEGGARFGEALDKVPGFLPPQVNAMLHAGEKLGDLKKVLPACREVLRVAPDTTRSSTHYMVGMLLVFAPLAVWLISMLMIMVVPKFKEVAAGMGVPLSPLTLMVFHFTPHIIYLEAMIFVVLISLGIFYIGGPNLMCWMQAQFRPFLLLDWFVWQIPWKRKKLLRAFSAMLAVLLDGGVPEAEAVRLAGESTANVIGRHRARRVIAALEQGGKLDEAVRAFDDNGEFHWRLTNAVHARSGFMDALRGWHEALEAKAFQQEETATHMMTSGLVILNGLVVALIATAMFGILIAVLKGAVEL